MKKEYYELEEQLEDACCEGLGGFYEWNFSEREGTIDDCIQDWCCNKDYKHKLEQLKLYIKEEGIEFGL